MLATHGLGAQAQTADPDTGQGIEPCPIPVIVTHRNLDARFASGVLEKIHAEIANQFRDYTAEWFRERFAKWAVVFLTSGPPYEFVP